MSHRSIIMRLMDQHVRITMCLMGVMFTKRMICVRGMVIGIVMILLIHENIQNIRMPLFDN